MAGARALRSVLLAALSILDVRAGGAEVRLPAAQVTWRSLQTPSFRLVGDASPGEMRAIGNALELFRSSLLWLVPGSRNRSPVPTLVLVFANERSFAPYGGIGFDDDQKRIGAFHRTRWGNYMAIDASAEVEDPLSVVYKGYVHFFVGSSYPSLPFWVATGLAEYFSTLRVGPDGLEVGRPAMLLLAELRSGSTLSLARLLEAGLSDPEPRDRETALLYRAKAWVLVHWALVGQPEMMPRLVDFLGRVNRGEEVETALAVSFGLSLEQLERRLDDYARQPTLAYRVYSNEEISRPEIGEAVPIPRAEALGLLAEFLAHAGAVEEARAHLEAAAESDPGNGDVVALRAHLEELAGRPEGAGELYRRAAGLPSRRACSPAHAAFFWLERAGAAAPGSEALALALEKARREAERAVELDPDYGEPWALRGLIELRSGDATSAVVTLAEAHRRLPDRGDVLFNRFLANLQAGQTVVAQGIAAGSLRRLDPERAAEARRLLGTRTSDELIETAVAEVKRRFEAGELDSVAEPLREALTEISDPRQREALERQIELIESKAAEKRLVLRYNQAVSLVNSGEYARARAVLDRVLEECGGERVCSSARKLRAELAPPP